MRFLKHTRHAARRLDWHIAFATEQYSVVPGRTAGAPHARIVRISWSLWQ